MKLTPEELLTVGNELCSLEAEMVSMQSGHADSPMPEIYYERREQLWETYTAAYQNLLAMNASIDEELREQAEDLLDYFSDKTL